MPTITEQTSAGYAHCRNARCPGEAQVEVKAVREEMAFTFEERGGDGAFKKLVSDSTISYRFADEGEAPCPACGESREVTGEPRPTYQPLSGHDPRGLLAKDMTFDASAQAQRAAFSGAVESDEEMELRLRAQLREEEMMVRLREEMEEK